MNDNVGVDIAAYRKSLIPKWIRFFAWLFVVMAASIPLLSIFSLITELSMTYSVFGLSFEGDAFHPFAILIQLIILYMGISAYGLLYGKSWGLDACLVNGYLGMGISLYSTFTSGGTSINIEPVLQIPYVIKLHKIRAAWRVESVLVEEV